MFSPEDPGVGEGPLVAIGRGVEVALLLFMINGTLSKFVHELDKATE